MTTYTADDFAKAEFARNRDGRIAARLAGGTHGHEWTTEGFMGAQVSRGDADMASELWAPVQEQPRPLAPEDVTRALNAAARSWFESTPPEDEPHDTWKVMQATWAALRDLGLIPEPPTRDPESEKIEEKVATAAREAGLHLDVEDARKIADSLAAQGVRAES